MWGALNIKNCEPKFPTSAPSAPRETAVPYTYIINSSDDERNLENCISQFLKTAQTSENQNLNKDEKTLLIRF